VTPDDQPFRFAVKGDDVFLAKVPLEVDVAAALLCDAPRLARMGRQCLKLIDERYNEKAMAKVFDNAVAYALEH
jgi:hypothetical protein